MHTRKFIHKISESADKYPEVAFTRKGSVYTCVNPYSYHLVRHNWDVYNSMDGLFVDGFFMCSLIRLLWGVKVPRLSFDMVGMATDLFHRLDKTNETIYFIGSKQDCLESSLKNIRAHYPNMTVVGYRNGYFDSDEQKMEEIRHIIEVNPDFVIVGMGSPLQEKFALALKDKGYKGIVFTCGGFLHQTADRINYYPEWVNKYNLRALYRIYREKGMIRRLYNVLIQFPSLFFWDSMLSKWHIGKQKYILAKDAGRG